MNHPTRDLALVLASMSCLALVTAPHAAAVEAPPLSVVERSLPSGAKAVLWPQPGSGTVLVTVAVPAGSQDEPAGNGGLSHYLEHLLFDGFDTLDERGVTESFERLSAYMNAFTREQATVFFALVPRDRAVPAAELMAGMLTRSTIGPEVFDKERKVILEELAKDHASPSGLREEALRSVLWGGTPLAHPVGGTEASVAATDRETVVDYWRRHYRPDGFRVLVTGDLPIEGLEEVLAPFVELERAGAPPIRPDPLRWPGWGEWAGADVPAAPQTGGMPGMGMPGGHGMGGRSGPPSGGTLAVVVAAPDRLSTAGTEIDVLARWLESAEGPLASVLVPGLAGEVSAARLPRQPRDLIEIRVEASAGVGAGELLAQTLGALVAAADGPDDVAADQIQDAWAADRALNDQRLHYAAVFYGEALAASRGGLAEALQPLEVPAPDLRTAATLMFSDPRGRTRAAWLGSGGPEGREPLPEPARVDVTPPRSVLEAGPLESRVVTLDNGVVVGILPELGSAVFGIHLLVADRALAEPAELPGIADLVHRLLPGGTVLGGRSELERRISRSGFEVKAADSPAIPFDDRYHVPDFSYVRMEGPAAGLGSALEMLAEMVRQPAWDDDGWREAVAGHDASRAADNAGSERAEQLFMRTLLGPDHPLARPVSGPAEAPTPSPEEVLSLWQSWPDGYFRPDHLVVTVASPLPADQTVMLVRDVFSGGPAASPRRGPYPPAVAATDREVTVDAGPAPQVTVLWGRAVEVAAADRAALLVAMEALSDRMTAGIREREGLAYRLGASVRHLPDGRWIVAARVGTRPDNARRVADLVNELVEELGAAPPTADDLDRLSARRQRTRMLRTLSAASRAYRVGRAIFEGSGSPLAVDEAALAAVSPADVQHAVSTYLVTGDTTLVISP
jgi:predicted Zn-dependent peptidase